MKSIYEIHQKAIEVQEHVLAKQKQHLEKQKLQSKNDFFFPTKQMTMISLVINLVLLAFCLFVLMIESHAWIWSLLIIDIISIAVNLYIYAAHTK